MEAQTTMLLNILNPYVLLGIGILLIAFEAFFTTFIFIWFGLGFIITSLISLEYEFSDGLWQLAVASVISLFLLILFRKKVAKKFLKSDTTIKDNFLNEKGIGQIKNSKVFYKGTYWDIDSELSDSEFKEGEKVIVSKTEKNFASISKNKN